MNNIDRNKLNMDKIRNYPTVNASLNKNNGEVGTPSRDKFTDHVHSYFTGQLIENTHKNAHLTQEELASRVGTNKSYISRIENGKLNQM